jgi:protein O-GlcNAc transferase
MTKSSSGTIHQPPNLAAEHLRLGALHLENNRLIEAEAEYRKATEIDPGSAEAFFKLGNVMNRRGLPADAEACYRNAIAIAPDYVKALYNLGNTLKRQSRLPEAEASYRRAIEVQPDFADAHINLGVMLVEQARYTAAESCFRRALEFRPDDPVALFNLGIALEAQERFDAAEAAFLRTLAIRPDDGNAAINLGNMYKAQDRAADAVALYRRTIEFAPGNADICNNLACILVEQGEISDARVHFRKAVAARTNYVEALSSLLFLANYMSDDPAEAQIEAARDYGRMLDGRVRSRYAEWLGPPPAGQLRVGLVSADLRNHPVGFFLDGLLSHIDPTRIGVYAYPTIAEEDELSDRLRNLCAAWKPLVGLDDAAAASMIHADGVHVLIDLGGHTKHARLSLFAWKPAPVQASWLGYCATTGITAMDYYIADSWTLPVEEERHFTEKIWRLPESYLCYAPAGPDLPVSPLPAQLGAPLTFGSFNNLSKMGPPVVDLWARVLAAVPGSRLFLKTAQLRAATARQRVIDAFAARAIGADRLILEADIPDHGEHLAAYHRVDIALDTFPYNGVTTSAEALWMGVPVLTLAGERFLSRQGLGLLMNAGLREWVAFNPDDYVAKAVAGAANLQGLARLRASMRERLQASAGFNAPRFARHFADALWQMWRCHEDG